MYYSNEVISYFQANKILALKLDHALAGAGKAVSNQIETIAAGATRALYYTSCFTDEYQDVCQKKRPKTFDSKTALFIFCNMAMLRMTCLKYISKKYLNIKPPINWSASNKCLWLLISILPPVHSQTLGLLWQQHHLSQQA